MAGRPRASWPMWDRQRCRGLYSLYRVRWSRATVVRRLYRTVYGALFTSTSSGDRKTYEQVARFYCRQFVSEAFGRTQSLEAAALPLSRPITIQRQSQLHTPLTNATYLLTFRFDLTDARQASTVHNNTSESHVNFFNSSVKSIWHNA